MDINELVNLSARRWAPIYIRLLAEGVPGRQAVLLQRSGAPRSGFAATIQTLILGGLVNRNPGHGHPLRPEFLITEKGIRFARALSGMSAVPDQDILRRSWSLPVLAALRQPQHFSHVGQLLRPITDRALSQSLKGLEGAGLVERHVNTAARPPRPTYGRTRLGLRVAEPLDGQIVWS